MSDLIERLRSTVAIRCSLGNNIGADEAEEAIAEIEALRTRAESAEAVLKAVTNFVDATFAPVNSAAAMDELGDDHELTVTVAQFRSLYQAARSTLSKIGDRT